jgi:6-pyruvoyltetrahydropterin/6-carboxytetrahydropterin synthase
VTIEADFAAAHRLRNYRGGEEPLHGHNFRVQVSVAAEGLDEAGMAIDFKDLERETREVLGALDHQYLNEVPPFRQVSPSAENIAKHLFEALSGRLKSPTVRVHRVTVFETERLSATYRGEGR